MNPELGKELMHLVLDVTADQRGIPGQLSDWVKEHLDVLSPLEVAESISLVALFRGVRQGKFNAQELQMLSRLVQTIRDNTQTEFEPRRPRSLK